MSNLPRICLLIIAFVSVSAQAADGSCAAHVARWLDPNSGETLAGEAVLERMAKSRIVLLGESHTTAAHHRWQAYMLSALHSRQANMMVGFEMLPRRAQPVLDAWSLGELGEKELLEQTNWREVWGYDPKFYLPLLHFTRLNRLPALALNVDRELISQVGEKGWRGVPEDQRQGIADPAPARDEYRDSLARLYGYKQTLGGEGEDRGQAQVDLEEIKNSDEFANFVDAQLTWDRAMAEALAAAHRRDPGALVVGIVGRGHLEYGYGIPHQLADMGVEDVDVLLPVDADSSCDPLPMDLASAVFVVDADGAEVVPARPRLGVIIESDDDGVKVLQVVEDSVADAIGMQDGDLIQQAAGFDTRTTGELIDVISRQAPGTWLPLKVRRGDKTVELVAKFPQQFD